MPTVYDDEKTYAPGGHDDLGVHPEHAEAEVRSSDEPLTQPHMMVLGAIKMSPVPTSLIKPKIAEPKKAPLQQMMQSDSDLALQQKAAKAS